jgi:uncharacterized YccA/Bax inhibitor family protein
MHRGDPLPTSQARPAKEKETGNPAFNPAAYAAAPKTAPATMTVAGTAFKALIYSFVLIAAAVGGWSSVTPDPGGAVVWPGWVWWVGLAAFVFAMVTIARPESAALTGLVYAALEGAVLGAISAIYEIRFDGIIVQAVILTIAVLLGTLLLYLFGIVRATSRLARGVIVAMGGLVMLYLFGWILSLFGVDAAFWARPTSFGIFFSVVVVGLAALNLVLDFDMIERFSAAGAPRQREWYAAFGLVLTLVWLYLEVLRLIALSRARQ